MFVCCAEGFNVACVRKDRGLHNLATDNSRMVIDAGADGVTIT